MVGMEVGVLLAIPFFVALIGAAVHGAKAVIALVRGDHVVIDVRQGAEGGSRPFD